MTATTTQHMNARGDQDLLNRFIAKAEMMGVENPAGWVQAHMGNLIVQTVDGTQTVSDVHAYADEVRRTYIANTPQSPGLNLGAVTDAHLQTAIEAVQALTAP